MATRRNMRQIRAAIGREVQNCTENSAQTDCRKMSWPQTRGFRRK